MKPNPVSPEAQDLDAFFDHDPDAGHRLDPKDRALAAQVRDLARSGVPASPRFYHQLERKLQQAAAKRAHRPHGWNWPVLAGGLGALALLALILLSGSLIRQMLGQPALQPTAAPLQAGPAGQPTPATPAALPTGTGSPAPVSTEPAALPGGIQVKTAFPQGPQSVPDYRQVQTGEPLTGQSALAMAARLGINGHLYQATGEGGGTTYTVADDAALVLFWGSTNNEFSYMKESDAILWSNPAPLPLADQERIASDWLKSRGLLDFAYHVEPLPTDPGGVMIVQELEGGSLYNENPYDPAINVHIDSTGQVTMVFYRRVQAEGGASIPLRSAEAAWAAYRTGQEKRVFFQTLDFHHQRSLQTWGRTYNDGEKIDLYGYASVLQSAETGQPPLVAVGNLTIRSGSADASQIPMRSFLHVWGVYHRGNAGQEWLELEGTEPSLAAEIHLGGTIARENGTPVFKSDQGEMFSLPGLPADIQEGLPVSVSGARVGDSEINWYIIQSEIETDKNQTYGSFPLVGQPGTASQPGQPTAPLPTNHQPGERIEGLTGYISSFLYTNEARSSSKLVNQIFIQEPQADGAPGWQARLDGSGAAGIEAFQHLPVKVWGTYQVDQAEAVIAVDRYEPLWPGVKIEAWFGKIAERTVEGKNVFVLTDDQGKEWVVQSSIQAPQSLAQMGWNAGTEVVVEGYPSQDQPNFGGLPVLTDFSTGLLGIKGITRENYQVYSNQPQVEVDSSQADLPPDHFAVEKIELVYDAVRFQGPMPQEEALRRLQPLWRFSGHMEDGRAFELLLGAGK